MKVSEAQLIRSICLESLQEFVREFWDSVPGNGRLVWGFHLTTTCAELQKVAERVMADEEKLHDLILNLPTSTGKSLICSVLFPAWLWAKWPHAQICGASYSEALAMALALKCRDVIKSDKYQAVFPHVRIRTDQDNKGYFQNTKGGVRYAVGAEGTVQGMHYHLVVIDDPVDPNRAVSEAVLAAVNYWIRHTLSGRMKDQRTSVTILVMQRLHVNDPTADMLKTSDVVRHIRIPANTDYPINPPELSQFYVSGLMDPIRLSKKVLADRLKKLGPDGFAGQYGQSPIPAEGSKFKVSRLHWDVVPDNFKRVVRAWDKAVTPEKGAQSRVARGPAFTAGVLGGMDYRMREWVLDVKRARMDSHAREKLIYRTAQADAARFGIANVIIAIEQEPGGAGKESAEATARRLAGFKVVLCPASGSKDSRADEFSFAVNAGSVYLPAIFRHGNDWIDWAFEFVQEMTYWPQTTYLDQIDAASLMHRWVTRGKVRVGGPPLQATGPTEPETFRNNFGEVVTPEQFVTGH